MSYDRIRNPLVVQRAASPLYAPTPIVNSPVSPYEAPPDSVGLSEVTAPLWRRKLTILGVAILGVAIGLAVTFLTKPTYRAKGDCQADGNAQYRSEEHTSELQSHVKLVCRLLLEKKNKDRNDSLQQSAPGVPQVARLAAGDRGRTKIARTDVVRRCRVHWHLSLRQRVAADCAVRSGALA